MTEVERLLREYIAEHRGGGKADPIEYVRRLEGVDRKELAALIDGYLERAPRQEWDPDAYESSNAPKLVESLARSLQGEAGLWPSLLPRLRDRASMKRDEVVGELAARLGAVSKREKVAVYYHQMERGTLPASGVSDRVLEALAQIVGQSAEALRTAGAAFRGPSPAAPTPASPAFARKARAIEESDEESMAEQAAGEPTQEWDEVDRLFRGG